MLIVAVGALVWVTRAFLSSLRQDRDQAWKELALHREAMNEWREAVGRRADRRDDQVERLMSSISDLTKEIRDLTWGQHRRQQQR